jgi:hypothetical protein
VFACVGFTLKVNAKAVPRHTMKACRERRGTAQACLTLSLDTSVESASHPGHFTLKQEGHGADWTGGWMGSRVGLNALEKKKYVSTMH